MSDRDPEMSTSRGRDPELRLGKLTLAKAEDYPTLVARVEAFCSVALPALDGVAQRRVLSNVFLEIIMCVPADSPHGKLMMSMIQSHNQRGDSMGRSLSSGRYPSYCPQKDSLGAESLDLQASFQAVAVLGDYSWRGGARC